MLLSIVVVNCVTSVRMWLQLWRCRGVSLDAVSRRWLRLHGILRRLINFSRFIHHLSFHNFTSRPSAENVASYYTCIYLCHLACVRGIFHLLQIKHTLVWYYFSLLPPTKEEVHIFACVCLSVCLLARLIKNACMDLDEMLRVDRRRDMDGLINFRADPDYSPDAGTGLLSPISYKRWYAEFYVGKIPRIRIGTASRCSDAWF